MYSSNNPNLPKEAMADLLRSHILTLKGVMDAETAKDWSQVYPNPRTAAAQFI